MNFMFHNCPTCDFTPDQSISGHVNICLTNELKMLDSLIMYIYAYIFCDMTIKLIKPKVQFFFNFFN